MLRNDCKASKTFWTTWYRHKKMLPQPERSMQPARRMAPYRAVLHLTLLMVITGSAPTLAASPFAGRWFQIEAIVIATEGSGTVPLSRLPKTSGLPVPGNAIRLQSSGGEDPTDPFVRLPAGLRTMNTEKNKLAATPGYRILYHQAWRQPVLERSDSQPVYIRGGEFLGSQHEMEGTLNISVATYLAVEADLRLSVQGGGQNVQDDGYSVRRRSSSRTVAMQEKRGRIKSTEVHYFDHPRIALLIRIDRYEAPVAEPLEDLTAFPEASEAPAVEATSTTTE